MKNPARPFSCLTVAALAVLGLPARAEAPDETAAGLAALGWTLEAGAGPEDGAVLRPPPGSDWVLPPRPERHGLAFNGPADRTGDGVPDLIVVEYTSRSFGDVTILSLAPGGAVAVFRAHGFATLLNAFATLPPDGDIDSLIAQIRP